MIVKIKLRGSAVMPTRGTEQAAGYDLVATSVNDSKVDYIVYHTGLSFEIPEGYCGMIFPRSSISNKDLALCNSVGLIDSDYRGEITFRFRRVGDGTNIYKIGDRIGQLVIMPYPSVALEEVEELNQTKRGSGGYGHTGA